MIASKRVLLFVLACAAICSNANATPLDVTLSTAGEEQFVISSDPSQCKDSAIQGDVLLDSPARALRHPDGELLVYATHFDNWYMAGPDWTHLKPSCESAALGAEDPDPAAVNDHIWIQALASDDGVHVIALASEEYMGSRHGKCDEQSSKSSPFPCWYSSITQLASGDGGKTFHAPAINKIVATPQVAFDKTKPNRMGFLTTSNIVTDGEWRYVLIYVDGYERQSSGTCLFRAAKSEPVPQWLGWDGQKFAARLDSIAQKQSHDYSVCNPLTIGSINRTLLRDRVTGTWIAVGPYQAHSGQDQRGGIFYSESKDLLKWGPPNLLAHVGLDFQSPQCPAVYKYPSLIDHDAPGFMFDSVGDRAYLYLTKVPFNSCKIGTRQLVRIPLKISRVEGNQPKH